MSKVEIICSINYLIKKYPVICDQHRVVLSNELSSLKNFRLQIFWSRLCLKLNSTFLISSWNFWSPELRPSESSRKGSMDDSGPSPMMKFSWFLTRNSMLEYFNSPFVICLGPCFTFQFDWFSLSMMAREFVLEISLEIIGRFSTVTAFCFGLLLARNSPIQRFFDLTEIFRFRYNVDFVTYFTLTDMFGT